MRIRIHFSTSLTLVMKENYYKVFEFDIDDMPEKQIGVMDGGLHHWAWTTIVHLYGWMPLPKELQLLQDNHDGSVTSCYTFTLVSENKRDSTGVYDITTYTSF